MESTRPPAIRPGAGLAKPGVRALLTLVVWTWALSGCGDGFTTPPLETSTRSPVTFNKDIAPIVFENCAPCHRTGQAAPFSLLTYEDVVNHAQTIVDVTRSRYMPRWLAEPGEFPILGQRRLSPEQIDTIESWVRGGMVEGDAFDLPTPPAFTDGWELGEPDMVLTVDAPFPISPGTEDTFRHLVFHTALDSDVFVHAVEFKPGDAPIHHSVVRLDRTSGSRRRDGRDGRPGFDAMSWDGDIEDPGGQFLGWAPGRGPIVSPDGMPWRLDRGVDVVVEVHVPPSGRPLMVQPTIGLFLSDAPPVATPLRLTMESKAIDIPPGEDGYVVTESYELPAALDLLSVFPHAHYLGREMRVTATLPDGAVWSLLHIRQWDFRWQQDYRYATPIPLPRGTILTMQYTYDNSAMNMANPNRPPVRVRWGTDSSDEMATLMLQVLPESAEGGGRLVQLFREREMLESIEMAEERVGEDPNIAENRALLGRSYGEAGRFAEAIPHLEAALALGDQSASTFSALGFALASQGRLEEAVVRFERAGELDPLNEIIHYNRGNALGGLSRFAEAETAYEQVLALNPDFAEAHANLGISLYSRGQVEDALPHFQRAVELRPDFARFHFNLASALATAGRFGEAIPEIQRALELDPGFEPAREALRRLQPLGLR